MYKLGDRIIKEGLSPVSRVLLGVVSAIFGLVMVTTASGTADPFFATMIGAFCFAVTLVCATWGRVRQFVGSLVGVALFGLSLFYLWSQMTGGPFFWGSRSEPSVLNAVLFVVFLGVPGITYAASARFGLRKKKP